MQNLNIKKNCKHAWTLEQEMKGSLELTPDETITYQVKVRLAGWFWQTPVYITLTTKRIAFILHYAWRPDLYISISWNHVNSVELVDPPLLTFFDGQVIRMRYKTANGNMDTVTFYYGSFGLRSVRINIKQTQKLSRTISHLWEKKKQRL